ncbi:MAG: MFS transporter [Dysgonamonadaceae bacterium]
MTKNKPQLWSWNFLNVCLANFLMACSFNLLMPSIPLYITEQLGIPQSQTGIVLSSYALAMIIVRPFSGYLVDIYSRKSLLLIGFTCYVFIFFGYFWVTTVVLFVLIRFLHGLAWGLSTVSSSTLAIDVVPSARRAEGIGYYGTFMNVAMAIGPFIAIHIYHHYGFPVLLKCAISMGMLGVLAVAMIKAPNRPAVSPKERQPLSLDRFFLVKAWPVFLNQLLPTFAWGTIGPFVAQYGLKNHIGNPGIFFLFWAIGIIASRIFAGKLVDRGLIHTVNMSAMLLVAASFFVFSQVHTITTFCITAFFIGTGYGMMFPALQTLYINMGENSQRGTANSTYLIGFDLGLALGMLIGAYITANISFSSLYLIDSILCLLSIVLYYTVSRKVYEKRRLR